MTTKMRTPTVAIALLVWLVTAASAFRSLGPPYSRPSTPPASLVPRSLSTKNDRQLSEPDDGPRPLVEEMTASMPTIMSRRRWATTLTAAGAWALSAGVGPAALVQHPSAAQATDELSAPASKDKVLVLGGSGFVGSQVVSVLRDLGVPVLATSTNGRAGTLAVDLTETADQERLAQVLRAERVTAVVSCVGTIGTDRDEAVNAATGLAAQRAKAAGVQRFVYITVAPEVKEFAKDLEFLQGYLSGKAYSRESVLSQFGEQSVLIEPTFIYGGGSFEANPPRVPGFYGRFIEGLLSAPPVRQVERLLSPGILKIALEPPVPVEAVAQAAVAGALGRSPRPILDSYDRIREAAAALAS